MSTPNESRDVCFFDIDGPLLSKSNFRRSRSRAQRGEWERQRSFEHDVAVLARAARPAKWPLGPRADSPIVERPSVVMVIGAHSLLDTANMAKSVTDALEGVLYWNDASIRHVSCVSTRGRSNQRAIVGVEALATNATLSEILVSAAQLGEEFFERWAQ